MLYIFIILLLCVIVAACLLWVAVSKRNIQCWFPAYLRWAMKPVEPVPDEPMEIYFGIMDHFEPFWNGADRDLALRRVQRWCRGYKEIAAERRDSNGRPPQHTMFYPIEEYDEEILDLLTEFCAEGLGDVEIHLHHDGDNAQNLRKQLTEFSSLLYQRHKLLRYDTRKASLTYGFIHGNWALNNSRRDKRQCGVDHEISILRETGCYADFTMPSAPDQTQPPRVNSIYFMDEEGTGRRSLARGKPLAVGGWRTDRLLAIQGPLCLNWNRRSGIIFPTVENGELSSDHYPDPSRVQRWHEARIHVSGKPDHIFIKTYTHGLQEANSSALLNGGLNAIWSRLESNYSKSKQFRLNYVTAWQMYQKIAEISQQTEN